MHLSVFRDFWKLILKFKKNGEHGPKRIHYSCEGRIENKTSLGITVCHHSASLVMPNGDARDGFLYPTLTLMIYSYILCTGNYIHLCMYRFPVHFCQDTTFHIYSNKIYYFGQTLCHIMSRDKCKGNLYE